MPGMPTGILISQQPVFQVAIEGTTGVQFTASAIGASGVQWYRNGTGIAGGTGAIYTLPLLDVTGFNGSLYKATFTNGVDSPVTTAEVPLWVVARFIPTDGTYGSGNYGGGLYKFEANTDKRHYYALKKIWPLKVLDGDPVYEADTTIEGSYLDQAYDQGGALLREVFPDTAEQCMGDWERVYGLSAVGDLPTRQEAAKAQAQARGGLSRAYFIGIASAMGYSGCQILEGATLQFIVSSTSPPATQLPAAVFSPDYAYRWYMRVPGATGLGAGDLLPKLQDLAPAWTNVSLGVPL